MDERAEQDEAAERGVGRRLFAAFILCAVLALVCWKVLPGAGVAVPWYVPVLGFGIIFFSVLARRLDAGGEEEPGEDQDNGGVAGRIGPGEPSDGP